MMEIISGTTHPEGLKFQNNTFGYTFSDCYLSHVRICTSEYCKCLLPEVKFD